MGDRLTREAVIDAAVAIVEAEGLAALSMRALCEKLDVAVTSIYWHVGNKEALLDALIERMSGTIVTARPTGRSPVQRVVSVARSMARSVESHGELIGVANQRGRIGLVFAPVRRTLAVELAAAGLRGERLADAVNTIMQYVTGYCITMAAIARSPQQALDPVFLWDGEPAVDRRAARRLAERPDPTRSFEVGLSALVGGLIHAS